MCSDPYIDPAGTKLMYWQ